MHGNCCKSKTQQEPGGNTTPSRSGNRAHRAPPKSSYCHKRSSFQPDQPPQPWPHRRSSAQRSAKPPRAAPLGCLPPAAALSAAPGRGHREDVAAMRSDGGIGAGVGGAGYGSRPLPGRGGQRGRVSRPRSEWGGRGRACVSAGAGGPAKGATSAARPAQPHWEHGRERPGMQLAAAGRNAAARRRPPLRRGERGARGGGRGVRAAAARQGEGPAEHVEGQAGRYHPADEGHPGRGHAERDRAAVLLLGESALAGSARRLQPCALRCRRAPCCAGPSAVRGLVHLCFLLGGVRRAWWVPFPSLPVPAWCWPRPGPLLRCRKSAVPAPSPTALRRSEVDLRSLFSRSHAVI